MKYLLVMNDRQLGYLIIFLIALISMAVIGYCIRCIALNNEARVIVFDRIGNLRIDDPVRVKGIDAGTIKSIELRKQNVLVSIKTKMHIRFHKGYHIDNIDEGIMGDRMLMIDCGDSAAPLIPPKDTLIGTFFTGVSEAIGMTWELHAIVDSFTSISRRLLYGTPTRKSLIVQIDDIVHTMDSLSTSLLNLTSQIHNTASSKLDSLDNLVHEVGVFTQSVTLSTPYYVSTTEMQIKKLSYCVEKLEVMLNMLFDVINQTEKNENGLWQSHIATIRGQLVSVQDAIIHIKNQLLHFKIYVGLF